MHFAVVALFLASSAPVPTRQAPVDGVVYVDQNHNGRRDPGERGLADVTVSNQDDVVATDAAGEFRITPGPNALVFVSVPDG